MKTLWIRNQGKKSKTNLEKDFYKLLNNANFGYDCRNNANICFFSPMFDEIEKISYLKKYKNALDPKVSYFVSSEFLEMEIEDSFNSKLIKLDQNNPYYEAKKILWKLNLKITPNKRTWKWPQNQNNYWIWWKASLHRKKSCC